MKKLFKSGNPSKFDFCTENFDKDLLIPKVSKASCPKTKKPSRHKSFDLCLTMKDFQSFDEKSTGKIV